MKQARGHAAALKKAGMFLSRLMLAILALTFFSCGKPTDPIPVTAKNRFFWVDDLSANKTWTQAAATLAYSSVSCNVYVRNEDVGKISQDLINQYGIYFTRFSMPKVSEYVYAPTEFFGEAGNRINIFFYESASGLAGYFWDKDFFLDSAGSVNRSNETNILYMNIKSAVSATNQSAATLFTKGTLTHEYQHMCNAHYFIYGDGRLKKRQMDTWANELCSTTAESIFSNQLSVYLGEYSAVNTQTGSTYDDFAAGKTDFLYWTNGFTQYVVASLLGTYLLSAIDDAAKPLLISTFLKKTGQEDSLEYLSSIEDLIATLQDPAIGYASKIGEWVWVKDFSVDTAAIAADWSIVMKYFLKAIAGKDSDFSDYIKSVTASMTVAPSIVPPLATGTGMELKMSGFLIGKTKVPEQSDLSSTLISTASKTGLDAYVMVWNGAIPSRDTLLSRETGNSNFNPLAFGTLVVPPDVLTARPPADYSPPASRNAADSFAWDRSMSVPHGTNGGSGTKGQTSRDPLRARTSAISGTGSPGNGSDGTPGGNLSCGYVGL